jgi:fatty acid desaturase
MLEPARAARGAGDRIISSRRQLMAAERGTGGNTGGIGLGGILVIVGIVLMVVWSFWVGLIVTLVGLIAFGGFAKGKWY